MAWAGSWWALVGVERPPVEPLVWMLQRRATTAPMGLGGLCGRDLGAPVVQGSWPGLGGQGIDARH